MPDGRHMTWAERNPAPPAEEGFTPPQQAPGVHPLVLQQQQGRGLQSPVVANHLLLDWMQEEVDYDPFDGDDLPLYEGRGK